MSDRRAPEFLSSPAAAGLRLPFSEAVRLGDQLFLSGQLGMLPGTFELVPGGIATESRQAMDNMAAVLERHGSALEHVVKVTVFLADMAEWAAFNEVYVGYFGERLPARSAFGVGSLAKGARVEIECVAWVPGG